MLQFYSLYLAVGDSDQSNNFMYTNIPSRAVLESVWGVFGLGFFFAALVSLVFDAPISQVNIVQYPPLQFIFPSGLFSPRIVV